MAERLLPKQDMRVRFPSPALNPSEKGQQASHDDSDRPFSKLNSLPRHHIQTSRAFTRTKAAMCATSAHPSATSPPCHWLRVSPEVSITVN